MRFGYFDDARREYVITTPRTPLPWINYLGSEAFFALCSNTAGGYAFYRDARLRRLTRYRYNSSPLDSEGFRVYIKDGESVWNPGWQPVQAELDRYCCRHGLGYTVVEGEKDGVAVTQELLVPQGDDCLLMRVTVRNGSAAEKTLRLFPYVEFCLWDAMDDASNFQRNYSTGEVEVCGAAIYHKTEYRERRDHYAVFWADRKPDGFDTSREAFIGVYGSPARPEAVFGDIKYNHGFKRFRLRSNEKVKVEFGLVALAHNIRKYMAVSISKNDNNSADNVLKQACATGSMQWSSLAQAS